MAQLTLQEVFDKVLEHSRQMTELSLEIVKSGYPCCLYRASNGNKCFIGALIPDELYSEQMEGCGVNELMVRFPELKKMFNIKDESALEDLQLIHDSHFDDREEKLENFAATYGINYTEPRK